jgi:hypothetical protein
MTSMSHQHKNHLERAQVAAAATVGYAEMEALKLLPSDVEREDTMSWPAVGTIQ